MGKGAWKTHSKILVTTFLIVVVYLLSWTPLLYSWVCMTDPRKSTLLEIPDHVYKIVIYFFMISLVANPVIYTCINKHFKTFLTLEIRSSLGSISNVLFHNGSRHSSKSMKTKGVERGVDIIIEDDVPCSARYSEDDDGKLTTRVQADNGMTTWDLTKMTAFSLTPVMRRGDRRPSHIVVDTGDEEERDEEEREEGDVRLGEGLGSDKDALEDNAEVDHKV